MGDHHASGGVAPFWTFVPGFLLILFGVAGVAWPIIQAFGSLSRRVLHSSDILTFDVAIFIAIHAVIAFSGLLVLGVLRRKSTEPTQSIDSAENIGAPEGAPLLAEKRPHEKSQTGDDENGDGGGTEGLVGGSEDEQSFPGDGIE